MVTSLSHIAFFLKKNGVFKKMVKRVAKLGTMGMFETIRRFQWRGEGELPASQGAISRATRIL